MEHGSPPSGVLNQLLHFGARIYAYAGSWVFSRILGVYARRKCDKGSLTFSEQKFPRKNNTNLFQPEMELPLNQGEKFGACKWQKIDNLIDASQKFISVKVTLKKINRKKFLNFCSPALSE